MADSDEIAFGNRNESPKWKITDLSGRFLLSPHLTKGDQGTRTGALDVSHVHQRVANQAFTRT